jgi:hypothetical protein
MYAGTGRRGEDGIVLNERIKKKKGKNHTYR